jgi:hypothetical protein
VIAELVSAFSRLAQSSPVAEPAPTDPPGWVPAVIVGAVVVGTWVWAYVSRRRARRR